MGRVRGCRGLLLASALVSALTAPGCSLETAELRTGRNDLTEVELPAPDTMMELAREPEPVTDTPNESGPEVPQPPGPLPGPLDLSPPPAAVKGCKNIDFLFVIDNSDSMEDEQENLARSFPGFVAVMQQELRAKDFHIMVAGTGGEREEDDEPTLDPIECEEVQGAGRRRSEEGDDCGLQGGLPFMTSSQPDLEATFSCVARVGTDGSAIEEPMDAVLAATSEKLNDPGRCNAGFLRDDAVLVVTFITDEEDRRSQGEPEEWRSILLNIKHDNPDALVVLGLVGDNNVDGGLLGGPCSLLDADGAPRLQSFVESLSGVLGSVCAPDYAPFFATAVSTIDSACDEFVAPVIF
jgi:hypothetical protein